MQFYYAGYSSSPAWDCWDPVIEGRFLACAESKMINADLVELPFCGSFHPHDDDWFFANCPSRARYMYTAIPGIMNRMVHDPTFGLASNDEAGRLSAVEFVHSLQQCVLSFSDIIGGSEVVAVELQSGPNRSRCASSIGSYAKSLTEILSWDWGETEILLEHCDAFRPGSTPSKGFLSLEEEILAIREAKIQSGKSIGIMLNWARSVIEGRSTDLIYKHIDMAANAGILRGLCFSGVAQEDEVFGSWFDSHMPNQRDSNCPYGEPASLLNELHITRTISRLCGIDSLEYIGVKISPKNAESIEDRVSANLDLFNRIQQKFKG